MAYRYDEAINDTLLDEAVRRVIASRDFHRDMPLSELADAVVHEVFCLCVTDVPDAMEGHRSQVHMAVVSEVLRRLRRVDAEAVAASGIDQIDRADADSFPASDPPAWIYSH